ncbi:conserved hypothetical protein [Trichinella spiralis]|uniref:hypothetical protein n=1 Tax=Trichinella spiralis TaxID=6334 RepID=UPI0001EFE695|nr:conserved hypothetical protein [Trichinella spiralis]
MISASNSNAPRTMVHLESIVSTDVFGRSSASVYTHGVRNTQFIATQTISKTQMHTHIQTNKQNHSKPTKRTTTCSQYRLIPDFQAQTGIRLILTIFINYCCE